MGLPQEGIREVEHTLEEVRRMAPDSLTVHSLAIKRAARLNMFKEDYSNLTIQNTPEMIEMSMRCAREMGMERIISTGRRIWREILKMWDMLFLEKPVCIIS